MSNMLRGYSKRSTTRNIFLIASAISKLSLPVMVVGCGRRGTFYHLCRRRVNGLFDCLTNRARARKSAKTSVPIDLQSRADWNLVLRMWNGYRIAIWHAPFEMVSAATDEDGSGSLELPLDLSPRLRFHAGCEFSSSMSSAASTTLRRTSSIVSPHVMQPGISGTVTEYPPYLSARTSAV